MEIGQIAVIGAGAMGSGIAQVCATNGYAVTMIDVSQEAIDRAKKNIAASVEKLHGKGQLDDAARDKALNHIETNTSLEAAANADLVIEAATENKPLKLKIFAELDQIVQPGAILATNTSSISITEIASATKRADCVVGIHFMTPVPLMQLVEVIRGYATDERTLHTAMEFSRSLGKTPVEAEDYPGFISNRVLCPMINEAIFCVMEWLGTPTPIHTVIRLS